MQYHVESFTSIRLLELYYWQHCKYPELHTCQKRIRSVEGVQEVLRTVVFSVLQQGGKKPLGWTDGSIQYKRSDAFRTSLLETHTNVQTVLRPEKLQSPIKKRTFPGENREAAEVLTANGTTCRAGDFALLETKSKSEKEKEPNNFGDE